MLTMIKEGRLVLSFTDDGIQWREIGDPIMGGLSYGDMTIGNGVAIFSGMVSLERGGGFASVRSGEGRYDLSDSTGLVIRARGDGKLYGLRLRTSTAFDGVNYQADFRPATDTWQDVQIPFASFQPILRGRKVAGSPPLEVSAIRTFGLIISSSQTSSQAGPFRLELESISTQTSPYTGAHPHHAKLHHPLD